MKKRSIIILMVSLSLVLLLGSSYALLRNAQVGKNPYVMNVGNLQVTFENNNTENLTLTDMYPMSDQEGENVSKELVFTVMNTGSIEARYNVYLEETSVNPEFKNHIRFITNKNLEGYNEPKTMGYDKYIDLEARLTSKETASYKVKVWLDQTAGNEYKKQTFTAKVVIESNQVDIENTLYTKINKAIQEHPETTIEEDGITYLSGSDESVNYNYVWYSGKLWRIVAINKDDSVKLVTQENMTTITWGENVKYDMSFVQEWLNEDFKATLYNYKNIIVQNAAWNVTKDENSTPVNPETFEEKEVVYGDVGLLTAYEYYQSYKKLESYGNGYLNIDHYWWTMTPYSDTDIWDVDLNGGLVNYNSFLRSYGIRPSIILNSKVYITGEGSRENPYRIKGDKETGKNGELINTRLSGEYVKIDNIVYRIIGIENNGTTKLTSFDFIKNNNEILIKTFGNDNNYKTSVESNNDNNVGYYLNNTWLTSELRKYITEGTYYLGQGEFNSSNYKTAICKDNIDNLKKTTFECEKTSNTWTGLVGLLRLGEMFSSQLENGYSLSVSQDFHLITPSPVSETKFVAVHTYGGLMEGTTTSRYAIRPTIYLKSNVIISDGNGTKQKPYEIALSE